MRIHQKIMNPIFERIPADKRTTFEDPWPALRHAHLINGHILPPEGMITEMMNQTLAVLGKQRDGSKVRVGTVCNSVVSSLNAFARCHFPGAASNTMTTSEKWSEESKEFSFASVKLLANLGYIQLSDNGKFEDKEFLSYHACARLNFENGQYKQETLQKILEGPYLPYGM